MARIVSFVILVVILLAMGTLFFMVMAQFFLPMFLAVLLAVIFQPLHGWLLTRCRGRSRLAASLATAAILLIVLAPFSFVLWRATAEGVTLAAATDQETLRSSLLERGGHLIAEARRHAAKLGVSFPADEELVHAAVDRVQAYIAPAAVRTGQFLGNALVGLIVMLISLYFFLVDGPAMIHALMRLSPLDDRHEQRLLEEFAQISRAVVLASLLSGLVQAVLAGMGFLVVGLDSVFLLAALTMLLSLVPFVGAASVWVPCCLWLYFYDGRTAAAVGLAIWGAAVISMVDNVIKPWVLRGRSHLHPLLALLSVVGGVQTLGPVGIFVGPMAVAFLQALLNILQMELETMDLKPAS